jgi:hypothetical protein
VLIHDLLLLLAGPLFTGFALCQAPQLQHIQLPGGSPAAAAAAAGGAAGPGSSPSPTGDGDVEMTAADGVVTAPIIIHNEREPVSGSEGV